MFEFPANAIKRLRLRNLIQGIIFFWAYLGCAYLERFISYPDSCSPTILLTHGLVFGVFIALARKDWPGLLLGGVLASCFFRVSVFHQSIVVGLFVFLGKFIQAWAGLLFLRMPLGKKFTFRKVQHALRFILVSPLIATLGTSIAVLIYLNIDPKITVAKCFPIFWLANLAALLTITPLVVKLIRPDPSAGDTVRLLRVAEGSLLLVILLIVSDCVFGPLIRGIYPGLVAQPYQIFPILLWAAIRFGPRGASMACALVAVSAAWGASHGYCAALLSPSPLSRALLLDAFVGTSAGFSLIAAALMSERLRSAFEFRRLFKKLEAVNQELKLEVEERSSAEGMLRAILDGANSCIISTDAKGTILTFNKAAQTLLGYSVTEVIGRMNLVQIHDPEEIKARAEELSRDLASPVLPGFEVLVALSEIDDTQEVEWTYLSQDGTRADVEVFMTGLFDQDDNPTGYIVVGRDITLQKRAEAALRETQSAVHNFFETAPLMMGVVEILEGDTDILHISDNIASAAFHGTTPEVMSHALASELGDTPQHIAFWVQKFRQSEATREPVKFEYELDVGGELTHLRATVSFLAVGDFGRSRFSYVMEDITAYRVTQAQLKRFAAILEATTDFVGMADRTGRTLYLNSAAHRLLGLPDGKISPDHKIFDVHPQWASLLTRREGIPLAMLEGVWQGESAILGADQKEIPVSQVILSHRSIAGDVDFISTIMRDMTEQKLAQERIRTSLQEKEALLKEIHHRVKNNMQVVSSLLQLQSGYTNDPEAKAMFEESRDRIKSMALIHEKLYQTKDLAKIDFNEYIPSLINMIFATQNVRPGVIRSRINVGAISFGVDTAIPLGLIINELVFNCLKHAFKDRPEGTVSVELLKRDSHAYSLVVRDDGIGLPPGFNIDATSSLGLKLVRILTQQIGGELNITNQEGSHFQINFNEAP